MKTMKLKDPIVGAKTLDEQIKELACVLTPAEFDAAATRLAVRHEDLQKLELEEKTAKADLKAKREAIEKEISGLARNLRTRSELRPVVVQTEADFARGIAIDVRMDTQTAIGTRPLTQDERQERMFAIPRPLFPKRDEERADPETGEIESPDDDGPLEPEPTKPGRKRGA